MLAQSLNSNSPQYLMYDGHGSTRQLVASDGSTINESYSYDAYGVMLGGNPTTDAPAATNLLYSGEQFDTNAQQYYLRARYYNPLNGLFNQVDPYAGNTQDPQSLHKYAYVHNNPVNGIDPTGLFTISNMVVSIAIMSSVSGLISGVISGAKGMRSGGLWGGIRGFAGGFAGGFASTFIGLFISTYFFSAGPWAGAIGFGLGGLVGAMLERLISKGPGEFWTTEAKISYGVALITGAALGGISHESVSHLAFDLADKLDDLGVAITSTMLTNLVDKLKNMSTRDIMKAIVGALNDVWYFYKTEITHFVKEIAKSSVSGTVVSLTLVPMAEATGFAIVRFADWINNVGKTKGVRHLFRDIFVTSFGLTNYVWPLFLVFL